MVRPFWPFRHVLTCLVSGYEESLCYETRAGDFPGGGLYDDDRIHRHRGRDILDGIDPFVGKMRSERGVEKR